MRNELFTKLLEYSDVDLQQNLQIRQYKKGDIIFSQGDKVTTIYFIKTGLVKLTYNTFEGKELIKSFLCEDKLFGSLVSLLNLGGSTFNVICLEDTYVNILPAFYLQQLISTKPEFKDYAIEFFRDLALKKEIREYELLCLSAEDRYQNFINKQSRLLTRITQQDLAKHIGITPIALSRLKHRIKTCTS